MSHKCSIYVLAICFLLSIDLLHAQSRSRPQVPPQLTTQTAITADGKQVILKSDGTWEYARATANDFPDAENLSGALEQGIRLLETKEYEKFLRRFIPPEQMRLISQRPHEYKEMLDDFVREPKSAPLLRIFKKIQGTAAAYNPAKSEATFSYQPDVNDLGIYHRGTITFIRVDHVWYLKNN